MRKLTLYCFCILLAGFAIKLNAQDCVNFDQVLHELVKESYDYQIIRESWQVQQLQHQNQLAGWKPSAELDFSAPYSKSIESILGVDGSAHFVQRTYTSPGLTLTSAKQFSTTGTTVSISSSFGFYQDFANNSNQFNSNWFNVSIKQPLFTYNALRYNKSKEQTQFNGDSIKYYLDGQAQLKKIVDAILDFEIAKQKVVNTAQNISESTIALEKALTLYKNGRVLAEDTLLMSYNLGKSMLIHKRLVNEMNFKGAILRAMIEKPYQYTICDLFKVPVFDIDTVLIKECYLKYSFYKETVLDSFEATETLISARKSSGITTNIIAGVGADRTASQLDELYTHPSQQQIVGLVVTIPVTGWQTHKRTITMAKIGVDNYVRNKIITVNKATVWAQGIYDQYQFLTQSIQLTQQNTERLKSLVKTNYMRFSAAKSDISDYVRALNDLNSSQQDFLDLIRQILSIRFDILQKTLYDCATNSYISDR